MRKELYAHFFDSNLKSRVKIVAVMLALHAKKNGVLHVKTESELQALRPLTSLSQPLYCSVLRQLHECGFLQIEDTGERLEDEPVYRYRLTAQGGVK